MKIKSIILSTLLMGMHCASAWQMVPTGMKTEWAAGVNPENAWREYPRPQFQRENWTCLNGLWDYAITDGNKKLPDAWAGKILVPFCPESALSGVGRLTEPNEILWYRRTLPAAESGKRSLLHFEALDYECNVFINGQEVGSHKGGNVPFQFDVTKFLTKSENELIVRVHDETQGYQLHGKQKLKNEGIWYTRVTGIWQTVWLENVNDVSFSQVDYAWNENTKLLEVHPKLQGTLQDGMKTRVMVSFQNSEVVQNTSNNFNFSFKINSPKLWSPDEPNLYNVTLELLDKEGKILDVVQSYTALRTIGKAKDKNGNLRFTLNGKSIFHWGPLDQGWWPDGLLTPPSDTAMLSDIQYLKEAGFNMIRKHIKVEPRRYYYHCDRLGMMMWQDQVSCSYGPEKDKAPNWTRMDEKPEDAKWPKADQEQFLTELRAMMDHLRLSPCIVTWVPFNEAWGQHDTVAVGKITAAYDKTRLVNIASGGNFWPVGDVADHHNYPHPDFPLADKRFKDYVKVVGEFGGHGMPIQGHLWKPDSANWGYGGLPKSLDEWKERYTQSINILCSLRSKGIAGGVYTQTTDVEVEINGFRTYDRTNKLESSWLKPLSEKLLQTKDVE